MYMSTSILIYIRQTGASLSFRLLQTRLSQPTPSPEPEGSLCAGVRADCGHSQKLRVSPSLTRWPWDAPPRKGEQKLDFRAQVPSFLVLRHLLSVTGPGSKPTSGSRGLRNTVMFPRCPPTSVRGPLTPSRVCFRQEQSRRPPAAVPSRRVSGTLGRPPVQEERHRSCLAKSSAAWQQRLPDVMPGSAVPPPAA